MEGDRRRKFEQRLSPGKEMVLDPLLVASVCQKTPSLRDFELSQQ